MMMARAATAAVSGLSTFPATAGTAWGGGAVQSSFVREGRRAWSHAKGLGSKSSCVKRGAP